MPHLEQPATPRFRLLLWFLPAPLLCTLIYWFGLRAGYQMDDFAWLGLHQLVNDVPGLLDAVFAPKAQGTIRPWSERVLFLAAWHFFGTWALPIRAFVFLTMFVSLALLGALARKLTNRDEAILIAPVIWLANPNLYIPLAWTAAYNQVLCSAFLLAATWLWIRYTETAQTRYYAWTFVVFALGMGALEINVVFPAIAALWAWCCARRYLWRTLPMFVFSAAYTLFHRLIAPRQRNEIYAMVFDANIFHTIGTYLWWTVSADRIAHYRGMIEWSFLIAGVIAAASAILALVYGFRRRRTVATFAAGWFAITIAPVIPLRNHISDYYLFLPSIGLALLGTWALLEVRPWRVLALAAAGCYLLPGAWSGFTMSKDYFRVSQRVQTFVGSAASAYALHPDKGHIVRNVDDELFWACWWDNPFRLWGMRRLWADADSEARISPFHQEGSLAKFFLPKRLALEGLRRNDLVAWELLPNGRLRNITDAYARRLQLERLPLSPALDLRTAAAAAQLGDGWYDREPTHRWMTRRATLRLRGPLATPGELILRGYAAAEQIPVRLTVLADGQPVGSRSLSDAQQLTFEYRFALPPNVAGKSSVEVTLEVDRTLRPPGGDVRDLGLALAAAEIRP